MLPPLSTRPSLRKKSMDIDPNRAFKFYCFDSLFPRSNSKISLKLLMEGLNLNYNRKVLFPIVVSDFWTPLDCNGYRYTPVQTFRFWKS